MRLILFDREQQLRVQEGGRKENNGVVHALAAFYFFYFDMSFFSNLKILRCL